MHTPAPTPCDDTATAVDETALPSSYSLRSHIFPPLANAVIIRSIQKNYYGSQVNLTGCAVWFAGEVFCHFVVANPGRFRHKACLELGSGAGLTGIVLHKTICETICGDEAAGEGSGSGGSKLVLTDGEPEVLSLLRSNCLDNGMVETIEGGATGDVSLQLLPWGTHDAARLLLTNPGGFDVIIGCDLFYNRTQEDKVALAFESVALLLSHALGAVFVLAFTRRDLDIQTVLDIGHKCGFVAKIVDECTYDIFGTNTEGLTDFWRDCVYEFSRSPSIISG